MQKLRRVLSCAICEFHVRRTCSFIAGKIIFVRALFGSLVIASCLSSTQHPKNQFFGQGGVSRSSLRSHSSSGWDYLASFGFLMYSTWYPCWLQNSFLHLKIKKIESCWPYTRVYSISINNSFELHQLFSESSSDVFSPVAWFVWKPAFLLGLGRFPQELI